MAVESVAEEYNYIREHYFNYTLKLVLTETRAHNNRNYDVMTLRDSNTGNKFTLFFDITSFFHYPNIANANLDKILAKKRKEDYAYMNNSYYDLLSLSDSYVIIYNYLFDETLQNKDYDSQLTKLKLLQSAINSMVLRLVELGEYEPKKLILQHALNVQLSTKLTLPIAANLKNESTRKKYKIVEYVNDKKRLDAISDDFDRTITALYKI